MTSFRCFADKRLIPALTVFLISFALFAVTAAPAWAQRTYDRLPIVKEGTTVRISPHVYVIPDESARGVPNVGIVVGSRATLVIDPGMGLKSGQVKMQFHGFNGTRGQSIACPRTFGTHFVKSGQTMIVCNYLFL